MQIIPQSTVPHPTLPCPSLPLAPANPTFLRLCLALPHPALNCSTLGCPLNTVVYRLVSDHVSYRFFLRYPFFYRGSSLPVCYTTVYNHTGGGIYPGGSWIRIVDSAVCSLAQSRVLISIQWGRLWSVPGRSPDPPPPPPRPPAPPPHSVISGTKRAASHTRGATSKSNSP